jgi:parallel beta-helix repeat protein
MKKTNKKFGILIICTAILALSFVDPASATTWSVDGSGGADFTVIQDAINNASAGDMIIVYSGVYNKNVVVDKSVTLKGVGYPVVDASGEGDAITLCADGITLVGFTATNSGVVECAGIKAISSSNTITGNNVCNNRDGIYLFHSCNNSITGNNVCDNDNDGIRISSSSNNIITGNTFVNDGLGVYNSHQNIMEDNKVNGKPLVYLEDASDYEVRDAGPVILVNCNNITVENLDLSNTNVGIELLETEDSKVINNTVSNNRYGIYLRHSNNNTITGNSVYNNRDGIYLFHSSNNNTITGNNVSNNRYGIYLSYSSNNNT